MASGLLSNPVRPDRLRVRSDAPHAGGTGPHPHIVRVELHPSALVLTVRPPAHGSWPERIAPADEVLPLPGSQLPITIATSLRTRGGRRSVMTGSGSHLARPDVALIAGLRKAHELLTEHGIEHLSRLPVFGRVRGIDDPWKRRLFRLAFLAPDIQHAILTGRQPALADLMDRYVPLDWDAQRERLGFTRIRPDMS